MKLNFFNKRVVRLPLTIIFLLAAILAIFPPKSFTLRLWANHAEWVALCFLAIGMFFLVFNQRRLMFVALGCSACICLYLSESTGSKLSYSQPKNLPFVRVAHFNVTNSEGYVDEFLQTIVNQNADIVSIQEVTYEWDSLLHAVLSPHYPHSICIPRFDPFGNALFSRYPFTQQDTFYHGNVANISVELMPEKSTDTVRVISSIIEPPLSGKSYDRIRSHLEKISFEINRKKMPVICVGEFNTTDWSEEIQTFKTASGLTGSRMGMKIPKSDGRFPLLAVPLDHIFYSQEFECIHFSTIRHEYAEYGGIEGSYQLKEKKDVPEIEN